MRLDNLSQAYKRAWHFAIPFDGAFSVVSSEGPAIAARNYALLLDSDPTPDLSAVVVFDMWAASINRYCDAHRVMDDDTARWALSSFLSRMWFDPVKANG